MGGASQARVRKLADRIRVIVAETLETRVKDPRLGFVTITDVRITGDLRDASIFYTVFGDEEARAGTAAALESAKGVLRSEVGKQTGVRHTPSLTFFADAIPETAKAITDLLAVAAAADAEVERRRAGAQYAGDPDPYKVDRVIDSDAEEDENEDDADDADDAEDTGDAGPVPRGERA